MATLDVMMQRAAFAKRHPDHVALGLFGGLADGLRHFLGLALAKADAALLVTDHDEGRKAEALAALDGLRDTVDRDQAVSEFGRLVAVAAATPLLWFSGHLAS